MNFELTDKQAERIARVIVQNNFQIIGSGHFDLSFEETVKVIKLSFGYKADSKVSAYYKKLSDRIF